MLKARHSALWCALGSMMAVQAAFAQQAAQPGQQRDDLRGRQTGDIGGKDLALALCLAIDNQKETQLAEFAAGKAQTPEVQQFAQKMVEDHGQMLSKLHQLTGGKSQAIIQQIGAASGADRLQTDRSQPGQADQPRRQAQAPSDRRSTEAQAPQQRPGAQADIRQQDRENAGGNQSIDFVAIKAEIAQECLQSAKKELSEKTGKEFDQCYMFGQVMAHMAMKDALTVLERHASPELQRVIAEAEKTTEQHLAQAKQISQKLDSDPSGRQLRGLRGETTPNAPENRPNQ